MIREMGVVCAVESAMGNIRCDKPDMIIVMEGICDITRKDDKTGLI